MKPEERIFNALVKIAILKGQEPTTERMQIMSIILAKYDMVKVLKSLESIALEIKFFPDISEILNLVDPQQSAQDIATKSSAEIIAAIGRFGGMQSKEAEKELGPVSWDAVQCFGGWANLCRINNDEVSTLRAQMREYVAGRIRSEPTIRLALLPERDIKLLDF